MAAAARRTWKHVNGANPLESAEPAGEFVIHAKRDNKRLLLRVNVRAFVSSIAVAFRGKEAENHAEPKVLNPAN